MGSLRVLCQVDQSHKAAIVHGVVLEVACGDYHSCSCYWQAMFNSQPCYFQPLHHLFFTAKVSFFLKILPCIYNMFTFGEYLRKTTHKENPNLQRFWPINFTMNNKVLLVVILGQVCLPGTCASFFNQSGRDEKIMGAKSSFWKSVGTETGRRPGKSNVFSFP